MRELDFFKKFNVDAVVALGFFDCVHLGHAHLISAAKRFAEDIGAECAVFTLSTDPAILLGGEKQIYDYDLRVSVLKDLGVDSVISCAFTREFMNMRPEGFLDKLFGVVNVKGIFVGADHTFGAGAKGNVDMLTRYAADRGIKVNVCPFFGDGGKISSSSLKALVKSGDVERLNARLTQPYFMRGRVMSERHVGSTLGFPTANLPLAADRLPLAYGIYATTIEVDGVEYPAMTNVGGRPTFGLDTPTVETYIFDFSGDLYDKDITLRFFKRTRDVTKFASAEALKAQLKRDEEGIRAYFAERQTRFQDIGGAYGKSL